MASESLDDLKDDKQKEITHYEGVLQRYGSGRWLDQGRRHLAELKEELRVLISQSKETI